MEAQSHQLPKTGRSNNSELSSIRMMYKIPKIDRAQQIAVGGLFLVFLFLAALTSGLPPVKNLSETNQSGGTAAELNTGDTAWVLTCSALVLFMTPGLAFFYGGMVNHINVISTMYQSFVALCTISLLWVIIGFSLAFGKDAHGHGIIGYPSTFYMYNDVGPLPHPTLSPTVPIVAFSMFQLMFAIITPALIAGSLAERVNFSAWMVYICIWHLIVYCPIAHMMWHPDGIWRKWGAIDFAGGTVVEMASGFSALAGAVYMGPRRMSSSQPANIPFIMLGTAIFWFGWLGFNSGSALGASGLASIAFATTNTSGASGMLTWIFLDFLLGKPSGAVGACNGIVVGLVAITPACGYVTVGSAMVIGAIATLVCYTVGHFMKERSHVDDSLDVFAVHGIGGLVGFLCTGIFCSKHINPAGPDGLIYGEGITLAKHIAIVLVLVPCLLISSYAIFYVTDKIIPVRVSEEDEAMGLDKSMHSEEYGGVSQLSVWKSSNDDLNKGSSRASRKDADNLDASQHSVQSHTSIDMIDESVRRTHGASAIDSQ